MSTFLTFLGIIAFIIIVKFIYDTYFNSANSIRYRIDDYENLIHSSNMNLNDGANKFVNEEENIKNLSKTQSLNISHQNFLSKNKYLKIIEIIGFVLIIFISFASSCEGEMERDQFDKIDFSESKITYKEDSVNLQLIIKIPPKYKKSKTIIEITPYLAHPNKDSIVFKKILFQGEDVNNNFPIITYETGGIIESHYKKKIKGISKYFELFVRAEFYHYKYPKKRFSTIKRIE